MGSILFFQPPDISLIEVMVFSYLRSAEGPLLGLDGGAIGLTEVGWLQAAVGLPEGLLHKAGGEWHLCLHK